MKIHLKLMLLVICILYIFSSFLIFQNLQQMEDINSHINDISWNKTAIFQLVYSSLKPIFEPINSNDTVTIQRTNNTYYVNHSYPENWSKIIGLEYVVYNTTGYQSNETIGEPVYESADLTIYNNIRFDLVDVGISINKPVYEQMYCGRQWIIEIEDDIWYINRFQEGNFSYCDLTINMDILFE